MDEVVMNTLLELLSKEGDCLFADKRTIQVADLSCAEVDYTRDGSWFRARCFFTASWMGRCPTGPADALRVKEDVSINDLAIIEEYPDAASWQKGKCMTKSLLKQLYDTMSDKAKEEIMAYLHDFENNIASLTFTLTPYPSVLVTLEKDKMYAGTLLVDFEGHITVLCKYNKIVDEVKGCLPSNIGDSYATSFYRLMQDNGERVN